MKVELNFLISISAVFFFLSFFEMPPRCLPFDRAFDHMMTACARATRFWNHDGLVHKELWLLNCYDYYLRDGNYSQLLPCGHPFNTNIS